MLELAALATWKTAASKLALLTEPSVPWVTDASLRVFVQKWRSGQVYLYV